MDFTTNFYFSYTYDVSRTLQENALSERNLEWNKNFYSQNQMATDSQFVWNKFLLKPFEEVGVSKKWSLEIVHGYIGKTTFILLLIQTTRNSI